jgi:MOSC domain-containing protein YiiM
MTPTVVSIQVGLPKRYGTPGAPNPMDRPWSSAIAKEPVSGPVYAGRFNLSGDAQADLAAHGGPEKAILAYAADHYPAWRQELGRPDLPHGAFGENLTISGLGEDTVCIGDVFEIGEAVVQVSQPRVPCYKLAYRWRIKDLTARVRVSRRPGWYLRVLHEGYLEPGAAVVLTVRPYPEWTVSETIRIGDLRRKDPAAARRLAGCHLLTEAWRSWLIDEAAKSEMVG